MTVSTSLTEEGGTKKPSEQPSAEPSQMEEGCAKNTKSLDTSKKTGSSDTPPIFPTPQYVFSIFSPRQITTSESNIGQQTLIKTHWNQFLFDTPSTADNPKKVRVKLSSLIVKMLNRLIKEKMLPRKAIYILVGESYVFVQILCASSALPPLMQRCERIGVGNV